MFFWKLCSNNCCVRRICSAFYSPFYFNFQIQMSKLGFYAVKEGRVPGVYNTWAECEAQVKGFSKAVYKKFPTKELAFKFVDEKYASKIIQRNEVRHNNASVFPTYSGTSESRPVQFSFEGSASNHVPKITYTTSNSNGNFYAVHIGKKPGVYRTWTECEAQIKGLNRTCYRKFDNEKDALKYVQTGGIIKASKRHLETLDINNRVVKKSRLMDDFDEEVKDNYVLADPDDTVVIFTDGACSENGRRKAMAGIGIYWGPNHPLNTSKRLSGRQTNNRAEIHAAIHALKQAHQVNAKKVKLYTDSQFLIRGITDWVKKWKVNGWLLATGQPVINKDDFIELIDVCENLDIEWVYVRAHDDNIGNEEADKLAVAGSQLPLEQSNNKKPQKTINKTVVLNNEIYSNLQNEMELFSKINENSNLEKGLNLKCNQMLLTYPNEKSKSGPFYAVKKGLRPGIYLTWTECEMQIRGFYEASYKKCSTFEEASIFIKSDTVDNLEENSSPAQNDSYVSVYTDGASSSNGQEGCRAGIGVYWGPCSALNTSQRLQGRQTNNRAEIHAIVHAINQAKQLGVKNLRVYTDSQFTINGITKWIHKWKQNGWKLADGKPVKNKEDFEVLDEARTGINIDFQYIKAHDNNPGNVEADQLAVAACRKPMENL